MKQIPELCGRESKIWYTPCRYYSTAFNTKMPIQLSSYRAVLPLALIYALRMLGLFMLIPLMALYAEQLAGATPGLMGIAFGIYGLTQACLQIPFGALSDHYGRKHLITFGLVLFIIGSLLAALSTSIYGLIAGRALQGAGAISGVVIALVADLTPEKERTLAMMIIGISIGATFSIAFAISPPLAAYFGVPDLFVITAILGLASIAVLYTLVPTPNEPTKRPATLNKCQILQICLEPRLLRLDISIFLLHALLAITFIAVPFLLQETLGINSKQHGAIYLPVLLASFVGLLPLLALSQQPRFAKFLVPATVILLGIAQLGFFMTKSNLWGVYISLWLFFVAFNFLEASLPAMIAKTAPAEHKGLALGAYSTAQFLGIFVGGGLGGLLLDSLGLSALFLGGLFITFMWLVLISAIRT